MSTTIDEKVVEMRFDNANFEKNISSTLNSLNNLNKTIDGMSGKNLNIFDGLTKSANSLDFSGLTSAVEGIASKFSNLGIIGVTALTNIANKAVNAGTQIVKSLTIDPVSTGFSEYELKMGSVQTIMNGANVDLETTMNTLEELNKYADDTIYSFSDMTTNIGKFVNAGVELDTAVKAIKGISNEAAVSGANAVEASRAMYNIAQAIGTGSMKLIDWKSIENANMATMAFKQTLIDTGKELNTIRKGDTSKIDVSEITAQNFRESISGVEGQTWITTEVMMKALAKYADETTEFGKKAYAAARDVKTFTMLMDTLKEAAQSGWAETMENIFGDFNQAKEMWTKVNEEISGILENQANARNDLLKAWKSGGGRDALLNSIANVWFTLKNLFIDVKKAFTNVFPKTTASQLINMTKNLEAFTKKIRELLNSTEVLKKVYFVFNGLFTTVSIIRDGFKELLSVVKPIALELQNAFAKVFSFGDTVDALNTLTNIGEAFRNLSIKIKDFLTNSQNLDKIGIIFQGVFSIVNILKKAFISLVNIVKNIVSPFTSMGGSIGQIILDLTAKIASFFIALDKGTVSVKSISEFGTRLKNAFTVIKDGIIDAFSTSFDIHSLFNNLSNGITDGLNTLGDAFDGKMSKFKMGDFGKNLLDVLKSVKDQLSNIIKDIADALKTTSIFGNIIKDIDKVFSVFGSILDVVKSFFNGLAKSMDASPLLTMATIFKGVQGIITAINSGKLVIFGGQIGEFIDTISDGLELFNAKNLGEACKSFAIAIGVLTASLLILSNIDGEKLKNGVESLVTLFAMLLGSMAILQKIVKISDSRITKKLSDLFNNKEGLMKISTAMIEISVAVGILSLALSNLSSIDPDSLVNSLVVIISLMASLVLTAEAIKVLKIDSFNKVAGSMIIFAAAINLLSGALADLSEIPWEQMKYGLLGITVLLGEMLIASRILKDAGLTLETSASFIAMAVGVKILANALNQMGSLSADQLTQGFLTLVGIMAGLVISMRYLKQQAIESAAVLLACAISLNILTGAISKLGGMDPLALTQGLIGVAAGLAALVIACKFMEGSIVGAGAILIVSVALLALAGAIKIMASVKWYSALGAIVGLAAALTVLIVACYALGAAAPVAALGALILAGLAVVMIGMATAALITAVAFNAFAAALITFSQIPFTDLLGAIGKFALAMVSFGAVSAILAPVIPLMLLLGVALATLAVSVAVVGAGLIMISEALGNLGTNGALGLAVLAELCTIIAANLGTFIAFSGEVVVLGAGLLIFGAGALVAAAGATALGAGLIVLALGMAAVTGAAVLMVKGLEYIAEELPKTVEMLGDLPEKFLDAGKNVVNGFIKGIKDKVKDAKTAIKNLGSSILKSFREKLGIHSPSKESESDAKNYEAGWEKGIKDSESSATETTESFGSKILDSFKSGLGELTGGSYDLGTIDITGDVDTSELTSQFDMDELLKGYNTDGMNLTSMENVTSATQKQTDAINDQTDAIKEQTEATEKLNLTREAILKDFDSNGTNLLHSDTDARKTEIKDSINNLNIDRFNKFFSNYGMSLDDVKEKTGATVADIATIFSDLPTLMDQEQIQFGDALYQELTQNLGDRSKIKELYDQTTDTLKNGLDKDTFLKALGFDTIDRLNQIFVATASNIDDFDKTITDTTKKAVISADELEKKAKEVIQGKYGNGADRVKALGDQYAVIQNKVNEMLGSSVRHDTNITVTTDTSGIEETKESLETLSISAKTAGDNVRQSVMEHANSIPTSVVQAAKDAMSYQDKVLQNGSKLPSEVVDKLKAMREEAEKTSDVIEVSSTKSAETMDRYASYLESVSRNADKLPTSVSQAISSLNNTESTTIKTEVDSTEVTEATSDVQELIDTMTTASDTTISPSVETTEVTPTFNLSSIDTTSVKTELTKALNDAAKDIDVKADITIDFAKVKDQFSKFFTQMTSDISNKASQYSTGMMNAFKVILDKVVSDLRTYGETNFTPLGGEFVQKIANGVSKSGSNTLANSFKVIVDNAIRDLRQYSEEFVTLGKNFTEGLAKGINENSENIKKAATNAAKAAYNAVKKELDINSPSKKTEQLGMYTDEGLAKGLDKYSSIVEDSATGVGSRLSDSLKETLADINLDGIDTAPTIRPILDLTDVESKASTLDSILSQQQASEISASYNLRGEQANMSDNRMNEQMVMMNNKLTNLLDVLSNQQPTPVDVNVELQGDARSLFNMVKKQGQLYTRTTGKYAF